MLKSTATTWKVNDTISITFYEIHNGTCPDAFTIWPAGTLFKTQRLETFIEFDRIYLRPMFR